MATKNKKGELTDRFMKTVKKAGVYGDGKRGKGLQGRVTELSNGELSKRFQQRVRVNGKQINVPIGPYPVVTLAEAREEALENARLAREGIDPRQKNKQGEQDENNQELAPTFADAAEMVITERRKIWKPGSSSEKSWRGELGKHASKIKNKRMDEITEDDIIDMAKPLWDSGKRTTADNLLGHTNIVFKWCIRKYRKLEIVNPVTDLVREHAPETKKKVKHHRSVPYYRVRPALRAIRGCGSGLATKLAQEFQIFTACRHGSVRNARWSEIDWENRLWIIPEENMKMDREHRVPLSDGAIAVLQKALPLKREDSDLIFPSRNGGGVISHATLSIMCNKLNLSGVPHGFRGTFATWCAEMGVPQEMTEAALAHVPGAIVKAYTHTDYMERRKPLMQAWSDHIEGKLPDNWRWREGNDELIVLLRDAQAEIVELRAERDMLKAA